MIEFNNYALGLLALILIWGLGGILLVVMGLMK